ncbi:spore germination protein [Brevibacillus fluminis]|uniref:Spore germination protein n=1 Tax=Brevibacillus fluminis TaxID=511487 RepID=A0A3M8DWT3_9BACL|nr:spore germination protein [Brevibacillus fluminis]
MATKQQQKETPLHEMISYDVEALKQLPLSASLAENKKSLEGLFYECSDMVFREFIIEGTSTKALLVFIDGMVNTELVDTSLLRSLLIQEGQEADIQCLMEHSINATQLSILDNFGKMVLQVLNGDTILFVDGNDKAISVGYRGAEHRSVSEPETETVIRGPREGFNENIRTNTALLRRKLKTPRLKMKSIVIGDETHTNLVVAYLEGIVSPDLVEEVLARLKKIHVDGILESGYIEEFIQDDTWTLFPQIMHTERPDTVAASLLEGRISILVDGTPFALVVPSTFWSMMQASEDYYERWEISTLLRLLRILLLGVALFTPALYIAVTTFHQEMLPTSLMLSIAAARESIPFPAVVEALLMEIAFEALREAGIRLPRTIGQAVSILGALVVGQAAVQAGIVSAPVVIVVSTTGIATFVIPRFNLAIPIRMIRFPLMILASVLGIFGIILGFMFIVGHLCKLRSFGIPYFWPMGPMQFSEWKDSLIRNPIWQNMQRPVQLNAQNDTRVSEETHKEIADQGGMKGEKP